MTNDSIENFDTTPPTVIPSKVRVDLTCSDPNESAIFDRFDDAKLDSMGSGLKIPPSSRNNTLSGTQTADTANSEYTEKCIGLTNTNDPDYMSKRGNKVFIDTGEPALKDNGDNWLDRGQPYNLVDLFCCKGELFQRVGTFGEENRVCLPPCPSNYTASSQDPTICIRNDSTCVYTYDLSANIQNNWFKTCAALYKQNLNLTSTIQSISTVVSTFSIQSSTVQSNYTLLNNQLTTYMTTHSDASLTTVSNYNSNFSNVRNKYIDLSNIQCNISYTYNIIQSDKLKFDTLFNNLGCSNFM